MEADEKAERELMEDLASYRQKVKNLEEDLAKQNDMAEGLQKSEERFRKIFDYSNDAIFLVDPMQDEILDVNIKACKMLGYSREELLAVPMSLIHPHEMPKLKAFAQSVFEQGQGWTNELSCLTKGEKNLAAEISASIFEMDGRKCMIALVRDITERRRLERENEYLNDEIRTELKFGSIIGKSSAIQKVLEQVEMVAPTSANVLIIGESGTGKELVARAIHENSNRKNALVRVNCASIPRELFESEFFGHTKGAFTGALKDRIGRFELADGGTLFLDEIGEIPLASQSKLLRVLQEGQYERVGEDKTRNVDVRIIAATNRDLLAASKSGEFRLDLYYRLSVFPVDIPPLREHPDDIPALSEYFVLEASKRLGVPPNRISRTDLKLLKQHDWPGNVRELQNVLERAVILGKGGPLRFDLAPAAEVQTRARDKDEDQLDDEANLTLNDLKRLEREIVIRALDQSRWKIHGEDGAAKYLGLKPTTLVSRMKKMRISKNPSL